ncbi:hypothetical protein [Truepera radiovictrix]|uniref:Uncharacterized protein n=1 Tax=Truepera radiovictrix (strain DSM 17093 / CIP 108686 / LMG 22925 / RQ-24) TaxID=649638 RepID=D7CY72_TRURR|nr:hypothetical protein [Truepera radiovictrix]ADI14711.1 hypothetical protein Trad_1592 [Truepera radiovictrix DSM 17093]WMT56739.1 hypothetical protein RCV51_12070 [Truepera radiovictrix]
MADKRSVHVYGDDPERNATERDTRAVGQEVIGGVGAEPAAPVDAPYTSPDVAPERPLTDTYDAQGGPRRDAAPASRPGWLWPVLIIALIILLLLIIF